MLYLDHTRGVLLLEKLFLSEEDYDHLAKSIILGTGIGILIGIFIDNIILSFSACTAIAISFSLLRLLYKKLNIYKKGTQK